MGEADKDEGPVDVCPAERVAMEGLPWAFTRSRIAQRKSSYVAKHMDDIQEVLVSRDDSKEGGGRILSGTKLKPRTAVATGRERCMCQTWPGIKYRLARGIGLSLKGSF